MYIYLILVLYCTCFHLIPNSIKQDSNKYSAYGGWAGKYKRIIPFAIGPTPTCKCRTHCRRKRRDMRRGRKKGTVAGTAPRTTRGHRHVVEDTVARRHSNMKMEDGAELE